MQNLSSYNSSTNSGSGRIQNLQAVPEVQFSEEQIDLKNAEKALLNILDDYSQEKNLAENMQKALLNILDDSATDKNNMENTQRAVLNILDDYAEEKYHAEDTQIALLNILDDFSAEKANMEKTQRAVLNILDDYAEEKYHAENTQKALLNILDDFSAEKANMENTQRAVLNILDDYSEEKKKVEVVNNVLVSANKELEQFAYVASHDLQEPLRTISNFVGLLKKKYYGNIDAETEIYIQFIVNATAKMQNLIKNLLDFSRTGKNITLMDLDYNEVLKEVIEEMHASIENSHAKITSAKLPVLMGNKTEMKRLFQNLISNAIKFQKKGVVPEIMISVEQNDTEYVFAVKDNGIGIEKEYMGKIFIIFQRLHHVSEYPGTGIGLAICKKIIALHRGEIWVESKLNVGSTFYFSIPKENLY